MNRNEAPGLCQALSTLPSGTGHGWHALTSHLTRRGSETQERTTSMSVCTASVREKFCLKSDVPTQIPSMVIYTSKDKPENIGGEGFNSRMDTHSSSLSLPLNEATEAQWNAQGSYAWRSKWKPLKVAVAGKWGEKSRIQSLWNFGEFISFLSSSNPQPELKTAQNTKWSFMQTKLQKKPSSPGLRGRKRDAQREQEIHLFWKISLLSWAPVPR